MRISSYLLCLYGIATTVSASVIPERASLAVRNLVSDIVAPSHKLQKRRGGGGGGGGRGGGSSSSTGSSSSSGSSSGARAGGSTGSSSGSAGGARTLGTSNAGGATSRGSGPAPAYGGYYGGGASVPYAAGGRSPRLGINPLFIAAPALAFGGLWAYGAYAYPYGHPYSFRNASRNNATDGNQNETLPVQCWCAQYQTCGCEDNNNSTYLDSIVGNGTGLNQTLARVVSLNGTDTLVINGTLPNGTTASGGTDDPESGAVRLGGIGEFSGWWMMSATVASIVYLS